MPQCSIALPQCSRAGALVYKRPAMASAVIRVATMPTMARQTRVAAISNIFGSPRVAVAVPTVCPPIVVLLCCYCCQNGNTLLPILVLALVGFCRHIVRARAAMVPPRKTRVNKMATNTNKATKANTTTKRTAAPATVVNGTAPTQAPAGTKAAQAAAPQPTLYTMGQWPAGQRGHRAYAHAVAVALTKANPKGFTLAQYRAALVAQASSSALTPPKGGWAGHNMPTWAAGAKQQWLVPVAGK